MTEFSSTPGDENEGSPTGMLCAMCRQPVQGLFVICQFCRHAFHVAHYREWFAANEYCPVVDCHHCCNHSQTADASPLCVSCNKPTVGIDHSSFPLEWMLRMSANWAVLLQNRQFAREKETDCIDGGFFDCILRQ